MSAQSARASSPRPIQYCVSLVATEQVPQVRHQPQHQDGFEIQTAPTQGCPLLPPFIRHLSFSLAPSPTGAALSALLVAVLRSLRLNRRMHICEEVRFCTQRLSLLPQELIRWSPLLACGVAALCYKRSPPPTFFPINNSINYNV